MKGPRLFRSHFRDYRVPVGLLADPDTANDRDDKRVQVEDKVTDKNEKFVLAPLTLVLSGAAAGVAGLHNLRERSRSGQLLATPAQK